MKLTKGAEVLTSDGEKLGTLERVIIDPVQKTVTHLVIEKGFLLTSNKVITIDGFKTEGDQIVLQPTELTWDEFPDFEETHYVRLSDTEFPTSEAQAAEASILYPPVNLAGWRADTPTGNFPPVPGPGYAKQTKQNIPDGNVALKEGARVISSDGNHVGNVEEVIVDSRNSRATHFVVGEGLLFHERKLIPILWIAEIQEDEIRLSVSSSLMERLPEYKLAAK